MYVAIMNFFSFIRSKNFFSILLILLLTLSRLIPHPPNFTPIIAIAVMSGFLFRNIYHSLTLLIISMLLSDLIIGYHNNIFFVYFPLIFITTIFSFFFTKLNFKNLFFYAFIGSLIFFVISNFGVWLLGNLYEKNLNGLLNCYILAIPFFKNTFFSTIVFTYSTFTANYYYNQKNC